MYNLEALTINYEAITFLARMAISMLPGADTLTAEPPEGEQYGTMSARNSLTSEERWVTWVREWKGKASLA